MSEILLCFHCGESLAALSLPISRRDACPSCAKSLHNCRMCVNFDPTVLAQCREDDAEEVLDKERANFCDWYDPSAQAFDPTGKRADDSARSAAEVLFGGVSDAASDEEDPASPAEDLFR